MSTQFSFSKEENAVLPDFRNKIGRAESTEDVKKIFAHTMGSLLSRILSSNFKIEYDDVSLQPESGATPFTLSAHISEDPEFAEVWKQSDLPHVIGRLAQTAQNRYRHLEKKA